MVRAVGLVLAAGAAVLLGACSEKPQTGARSKAHHQAWEGSSQPAYNAPGWKAGNQAQWDDQIRTRAQNQNEYVRSGGR